MKASVAMITYNHEKFIAEAIESVLMQNASFQYEIVIGEDCSSDRTREIVLHFQKRYPDKIRLLLPERNRGASKNFVETIKACKGDYIAYLDGDDYWTDPNKLQRQVDFLDNHPECSFCFNRSMHLFEDGIYKLKRHPPSKKKIYTLKDLLRYPNFIGMSSIMFRRGLFGEFPSWFFDSKIKAGDLALHFLNAQHGHIGYIDDVMSAWRVHKGGIWSSQDPIKTNRWEIVSRYFLNKHLNLKHDKLMKICFFSNYLRIAKFYGESGDQKNARKYLRKAFSISTFHRGFPVRILFSVILMLYFPMLFPHLVACKNKILKVT